jgi:hypothetical protein
MNESLKDDKQLVQSHVQQGPFTPKSRNCRTPTFVHPDDHLKQRLPVLHHTLQAKLQQLMLGLQWETDGGTGP